MTDSQREDAAVDAADGLKPLLASLDLLGDDSAGLCSGGVCRFPGLDTTDAPKPE
jgi:hypothetical protein